VSAVRPLAKGFLATGFGAADPARQGLTLCTVCLPPLNLSRSAPELLAVMPSYCIKEAQVELSRE